MHRKTFRSGKPTKFNLCQPFFFDIERDQSQWISLQMAPNFIGKHAMPPTELACFQEKINRRQSIAARPMVRWHNQAPRPEHFAIIAALGMRLEIQIFNEEPNTAVHSEGNITFIAIP